MKSVYLERHRKIGLNIAYYRKDRHFTQEALAEKAGISWAHLSKIEVASVGISIDNLFAIADALDVPPAKLLEQR